MRERRTPCYPSSMAKNAPAPVVVTPAAEVEPVTDPNVARVAELEAELLKVTGELEASRTIPASADLIQSRAEALAELERLTARIDTVTAQRDEAQTGLEEAGVAIVGLRNELDAKRRELATSEAGRAAVDTQLEAASQQLASALEREAEAVAEHNQLALFGKRSEASAEPIATADTSTPAFEDLPDDHPLKR